MPASYLLCRFVERRFHAFFFRFMCLFSDDAAHIAAADAALMP